MKNCNIFYILLKTLIVAHVLSKNMKIVKQIQPKVVIVTAVKNRCMLHGRVFVMSFRLTIYSISLIYSTNSENHGTKEYKSNNSIEGSNIIFNSLTFARSRGKCRSQRAMPTVPRDLANVNE